MSPYKMSVHVGRVKRVMGGKSILSQWPQSIKLRNRPCNSVRFVKDETFPTQIKMLIINAASLQPLSNKSS